MAEPHGDDLASHQAGWLVGWLADTGPSPRCRYYFLVAACVLAQNTEWLRNACLAAALLFPAIAAIHGIVLAALHNDSKSVRRQDPIPSADDLPPQVPSTWTSTAPSSCAP